MTYEHNWIEHTPAFYGDAHPLYREGAKCVCRVLNDLDDSWNPIITPAWYSKYTYRFKVEPHIAAQAGWPVVLLDADGREVPAEFVRGADKEGGYGWRLKGDFRLASDFIVWGAVNCRFKADGTSYSGESRLIIKQPEPEKPAVPTWEAVLERLKRHDASDELIAEVGKVFGVEPEPDDGLRDALIEACEVVFGCDNPTEDDYWDNYAKALRAARVRGPGEV